jgi:hypothetical protein
MCSFVAGLLEFFDCTEVDLDGETDDELAMLRATLELLTAGRAPSPCLEADDLEVDAV